MEGKDALTPLGQRLERGVIALLADEHAVKIQRQNVDPASGKELWRTPSTGVAFNCPADFQLDGKHYLYTARGQLIRASDGKKLPSEDFIGIAKPWCFFNTPSVIGNRIFTAHGSEGQQGEAYAYEIPETADQLEKEGLRRARQVRLDRTWPRESTVIDQLGTRRFRPRSDFRPVQQGARRFASK